MVSNTTLTKTVAFEHEDKILLVKIDLVIFEADFFDKININKSMVVSTVMGSYTKDKLKTKKKRKK